MRARGQRGGQAMIETVVALLLLVVCFLAAAQYADNLRARLLCDYAAARCARAATVGMNAFMVEKTANLATMAAAGDCRVENAAGTPLRHEAWLARAPGYLECTYREQARQVLDFDYWNDGHTRAVAVVNGAKVTATVTQNRPQFFDFTAWLDGRAQPAADPDGKPRGDGAHLVGTAEIEAHCPDWLQ